VWPVEPYGRKDLRRVVGVRLDRALLIEDEPSFALPGQEQNLVVVRSALGLGGSGPGFGELRHEPIDDAKLREFADLRLLSEVGKYMRDEFKIRNRLVAVAGVIALALDKLAQDPSLTLPEAVRQIQPLDAPERVHDDRAIYERGLAVLRQENPDFDFDRMGFSQKLSPRSRAIVRAARRLQARGTVGGLAIELAPQRPLRAYR
jgi:hypothetical protein